jgi:DNA-binding NtrC family response regulator
MAHLEYNDQQIELFEGFTIGSSPEASFYINDKSLNPLHLRFSISDQGVKAIDLFSLKGTLVNSVKIDEKILSEQDEIQIGDYLFIFYPTQSCQNSLGLDSKNPIWRNQLHLLSGAAKTDFPILLLGPSGSGKEVLATAIHKSSNRSNGPFQSVNCSALTETLIESELFGHVKGSFTGALSERKGAFEAARGGTLFLDEIGDLSYNLQAKLLRALENNEIRPVGSDRIIKTDVRIIAATHQNLIQKIQSGEFRSDLFYRLNVMTTKVPSLKERMEDFDRILSHFARKYKVRFSIMAIFKLKEHSWPGNIRELKNTVARAATFYSGRQIDEDLVTSIIDPLASLEEQSQPLVKTSIIKEIEKQMIIQKLTQFQGNQKRVSVELGIPKSTLHDRLKVYNINPRVYKPVDSKFRVSGLRS